MKSIIFAESKDGKIKSSVYEIAGLAKEHSSEVHAIVIGSPEGTEGLGASKIHKLTDSSLKSYTPEGFAAAIYKVAADIGADYLFASSSQIGKDVMPRIAASFGSAMISEITDASKDGEDLVFKRPIYAGKVFKTLKGTGSKPTVVTVRPNVFPKPESLEGASEVNEVSELELAIKTIVKEVVKSEGVKVDLTEANIVISGGRSLKNGENFKILNDLAEVLGGAVGASRAAVDAGYVPHSMQVGQTGKTVSPTLYIACGISGAIQHLAGMRSSKCIVAINTDENAPIFQKADYGIVGDLFEVVPVLTEEFKKVLSN